MSDYPYSFGFSISRDLNSLYYTNGLGRAVRLIDEDTFNIFTLTDAASIAVDASVYSNFRVVLGGSRTLANPTGLFNGQQLFFRIKQDATGNRTLNYGSMYKFPGGTLPVLSTGANALDVLSCQYDSTDNSLVCIVNKGFA